MGAPSGDPNNRGVGDARSGARTISVGSTSRLKLTPATVFNVTFMVPVRRLARDGVVSAHVAGYAARERCGRCRDTGLRVRSSQCRGRGTHDKLSVVLRPLQTRGEACVGRAPWRRRYRGCWMPCARPRAPSCTSATQRQLATGERPPHLKPQVGQCVRGWVCCVIGRLYRPCAPACVRRTERTERGGRRSHWAP